MNHLLLAILLCPAAIAFAAEPMPTTSESWNVRDHIPADGIIVQAHRGAGELSEENTLEAFQLGWKLGCVPESDLRTTKDGVIVAFHDNNFERVVKGVSPDMAKKGVKDITFDELKKLDVGSWKGDQFTGRHVSKMTEVFALMKGHPERKLYMDIKNVNFDQLAKEVKEYGIESQVILASTKYDQIHKWKKLVPSGQTLLWMGKTSDPEPYLTQRFEELRKANFADVTQVQIHTHLPEGKTTIKRDDVNPFIESDAFLKARGDELRQHGILFQTLPYGGTTREIYWHLLDLGLMSFATDHPDVTWDAIHEYYQMKK